MSRKRFITAVTALIFIMLSFTNAFAREISSELDGIEAASGIVMNADTGEILFEQNADEPRAPASITKIMTTLLVLEAAERGDIALADTVTVTEAMIADVQDDASCMAIPIDIGECFTVEELLYANMISSDCYASCVLGCYVSGSVENFCAEMNERAVQLGCKDTNFTDPSGYPDDDMYTTARSMLYITCEAMKNEYFRELVSTKEYILPATNINPERTLKNTNQLLFDDDFGAVGVKTGSSTPSGLCLVTAVERDGTMLISVIMGAYYFELEDGTSVWGQYSETEKMIDDGFNVLYERGLFQNAEDYFEGKTQTMTSASNAHGEKLSEAFDYNAKLVKKIKRENSYSAVRKTIILLVSVVTVICIILIPISSNTKRGIKRR